MLILLVSIDTQEKSDTMKNHLLFSITIAFILSACLQQGTKQPSDKYSAKGEIKLLQIAPKKEKCMGLIEQDCLVANGELFYDNIEGFNFEPNYYQIKVRKQQICDPNIINDCPQDVSIYQYRLLEIIHKEKPENTKHTLSPILEIVNIQRTKEQAVVNLVPIDTSKGLKHFYIKINPKKYGHLAVGDRIRINGGNYKQQEISHIRKLIRVANPDKKKCEAIEGNHWQPQGIAQVPTCITTYTDAGKDCTASNQCQGNCIVSQLGKSAVCAKNNSQFGCHATIENFRKNARIRCID